MPAIDDPGSPGARPASEKRPVERGEPHRSEASLVIASRRGDREAYAALVRLHLRKIFAVCLGILNNVSDSEDAAQDVCVKGMTQLGQLRDDDRFAIWITRIARNHCRDLLRARKRHRELLFERFAKEIPSDAADFSDLRAALGELSEEHRVPLMLFYFEGQSTKSLASALDLSQAGACTRLCRARRELRRLMEKKEDRR
jgi:RNA polymerase sigma-70 factor (ECF subfamily)